MTLACASRNPSPYETGRLAHRDSRLFRPGGLDLTERAIALVGLRPGARVLDLGCGAGDTIRWLRAQGFDALGIDPAPDPAGTNPPTRITGRAEALPFPQASVHAILAECSFSLVEDRARALAECARVLFDGGRLILSDLYARRPDALRGPCAATLLAREDLEAALGHAGFTVDLWEDHSRTLRECAARYLFEHGSLEGLWGCGSESSAATQSAMRAARAGYFLLIATRRPRSGGKGPASHER